MRAVRNTERGIEVLDVDGPTDGPTVHVAGSGICGSDLHLLGFGPMPVTLGHEFAGRLDDGSAVAVEPLIACGHCERCERGDYHLCPDVLIIGISGDGGMAEAIAVPQRCLIPLDPGVDPVDAAVVEPLAVAVHGLRRAGLEPGARVTVIGGGSIGLAAVAVALAAGCEVAVVARHPHQRAAAEQLGAALGPSAADIVVEAAGTESALETATEVAVPGAAIALLGTYWDGLRGPGFPFTAKELRLVGSFAYCRHETGRDMEDAATILAADPTIADALITHRFPLEDAAEAFRVAADRAAGAIKVILQP
jgi:threonine dehydrogenase-like Zn-dependent dehydrogenase